MVRPAYFKKSEHPRPLGPELGTVNGLIEKTFAVPQGDQRRKWLGAHIPTGFHRAGTCPGDFAQKSALARAARGLGARKNFAKRKSSHQTHFPTLQFLKKKNLVRRLWAFFLQGRGPRPAQL